MMTKISFWKSVPVREETRLPCLQLNCTACTSIIPVSYTHLDVYKRQKLETLSLAKLKEFAKEQEIKGYGSMRKAEPVSYTHLDVYKRQYQ